MAARDVGIFEWTAENRYPRKNAVKVFKSGKRAKTYIDAEYKKGRYFVDREIWD